MFSSVYLRSLTVRKIKVVSPQSVIDFYCRRQWFASSSHHFHFVWQPIRLSGCLPHTEIQDPPTQILYPQPEAKLSREMLLI